MVPIPVQLSLEEFMLPNCYLKCNWFNRLPYIHHYEISSAARIFQNPIHFFTFSLFFLDVNISNNLNATSNAVAGEEEVMIFASKTIF